MNNLLKAIEEGILTPTTKQRMIELEHTRDEIKLKLIKEEMKKPAVTKEGLILWLKRFQTMKSESKEHKQMKTPSQSEPLWFGLDGVLLYKPGI